MRWSKIEKALRDRTDNRVAPSTDEFWSDFRARARMTSQQTPGRRAFPVLWIPEWTIAGVCVLLLVGAGWFFAVRERGDDIPPNKVHSLRVSVPYMAVPMMYYPSSKATIVWVDGMTVDDDESGA